MEKTITTTKGHSIRVWQNPDLDYTLSVDGAKTLRRYRELTEQRNSLPVEDYGLFFAFSKAQFDRGFDNLVKRGIIPADGKVIAFGGGTYGTKEAFERWYNECKAIDEKIVAECDPYEVYIEEYNNYECCIDWDGDERAVKLVLDLYGLERTKAALEGNRFRACGSINGIYKKKE